MHAWEKNVERGALRGWLLVGLVVLAISGAWGLSSVQKARARRAMEEKGVEYQRQIAAFRVATSAAIAQDARALVGDVDALLARARGIRAAGDGKAAIIALDGMRVRLKALIDSKVLTDPGPVREALGRVEAALDEVRRSGKH